MIARGIWQGCGPWLRSDPGPPTVAVAARLAGGGVLEIATAGKPDCYRFCVHHSLSGVPLSLWEQPEVTRVAIAVCRSPTNCLNHRLREQAPSHRSRVRHEFAVCHITVGATRGYEGRDCAGSFTDKLPDPPHSPASRSHRSRVRHEFAVCHITVGATRGTRVVIAVWHFDQLDRLTKRCATSNDQYLQRDS
jgi:hypothetical protein